MKMKRSQVSFFRDLCLIKKVYLPSENFNDKIVKEMRKLRLLLKVYCNNGDVYIVPTKVGKSVFMNLKSRGVF